MFKNLKTAIITLTILLFFSQTSFPQNQKLPVKRHKIEIKGDWFYVDGEPFFIKGIGYSPAYPNEVPWKRKFNEQRIRKDFKMIKEAGFNTIRTWIPLMPEEIKIAREYDLFVMQGVWVDYTGNFTSEHKLMSVINKFYSVYEKTKDFDNILIYLLGNEPLPSNLFAANLENTEKFFKDLKQKIKEKFPKARISIANWVKTDFLNTKFWDATCINLYPYYPEAVSYALGYYGYAEWMKKQTKTPLIITELGVSTSTGTRGAKGYGGNTEEEQSNTIIKCYKDAINAKVNGVCVFEWIDEWWKNFDFGEDQLTHDENDPEEWFGIVYYDTEKEMLVPKKIYKDLVKFHKAIIIDPVCYKDYKNDVKVKVYINDDIDSVDMRIDEKGDWKPLKKVSAHWVEGNIKTKKLKDGRHKITIRAWGIEPPDPKNPKRTPTKIVKVYKEKNFFVNNKNTQKYPIKLELVNKDNICYTNGTIKSISVLCKVTDNFGKPVKNKDVFYTISEPLSNLKLQATKKTDKNGEIVLQYFVNEPGIISIAAGTEKYGQDYPTIKTGDVKHMYVYYSKMCKFRILKQKKKTPPKKVIENKKILKK